MKHILSCPDVIFLPYRKATLVASRGRKIQDLRSLLKRMRKQPDCRYVMKTTFLNFFGDLLMFKQKKLSIFVSGALMVMAGTTQAIAANTGFDNFTALPGSVAAGFLPESAPFQLSSPDFSQVRIADRITQLGLGIANTGSWDMITANETGPDAGRYLFSPFETSMAGVQRTDLTTGLTKTIVQPGTQGFVSGDASRWTPWGSYLTAEESWVPVAQKAACSN